MKKIVLYILLILLFSCGKSNTQESSFAPPYTYPQPIKVIEKGDSIIIQEGEIKLFSLYKKGQDYYRKAKEGEELIMSQRPYMKYVDWSNGSVKAFVYQIRIVDGYTDIFTSIHGQRMMFKIEYDKHYKIKKIWKFICTNVEYKLQK